MNPAGPQLTHIGVRSGVSGGPTSTQGIRNVQAHSVIPVMQRSEPHTPNASNPNQGGGFQPYPLQQHASQPPHSYSYAPPASSAPVARKVMHGPLAIYLSTTAPPIAEYQATRVGGGKKSYPRTVIRNICAACSPSTFVIHLSMGFLRTRLRLTSLHTASEIDVTRPHFRSRSLACERSLFLTATLSFLAGASSNSFIESALADHVHFFMTGLSLYENSCPEFPHTAVYKTIV